MVSLGFNDTVMINGFKMKSTETGETHMVEGNYLSCLHQPNASLGVHVRRMQLATQIIVSLLASELSVEIYLKHGPLQ